MSAETTPTTLIVTEVAGQNEWILAIIGSEEQATMSGCLFQFDHQRNDEAKPAAEFFEHSSWFVVFTEDPTHTIRVVSMPDEDDEADEADTGDEAKTASDDDTASDSVLQLISFEEYWAIESAEIVEAINEIIEENKGDDEPEEAEPAEPAAT